METIRLKVVRTVGICLVPIVAVLVLMAPSSGAHETHDNFSNEDYEAMDPITAALGIDSPEAVTHLQAQQAAMAEILAGEGDGPTLRNGSPESGKVLSVNGKSLIAIHNDFGLAVDDLYDRVASTPEAAQVRLSWQQCMMSSGFDFASPADIEASYDVALQSGYDSQVTEARSALVARDSCLHEIDALTNEGPIVEEQFEEWAADHSQIIEDYQEALDLAYSSQ